MKMFLGIVISIWLVSCSGQPEPKSGEPYHPKSNVIQLWHPDSTFIGFDSILTHDVKVTYTKSFTPIVEFQLQNNSEKNIDVVEVKVTYNTDESTESKNKDVLIQSKSGKKMQFSFSKDDKIHECSITRIHFSNGQVREGAFVIWKQYVYKPASTYNPRSTSEFR